MFRHTKLCPHIFDNLLGIGLGIEAAQDGIRLNHLEPEMVTEPFLAKLHQLDDLNKSSTGASNPFAIDSSEVRYREFIDRGLQKKQIAKGDMRIHGKVHCLFEGHGADAFFPLLKTFFRHAALLGKFRHRKAGALPRPCQHLYVDICCRHRSTTLPHP